MITHARSFHTYDSPHTLTLSRASDTCACTPSPYTRAHSLDTHDSSITHTHPHTGRVTPAHTSSLFFRTHACTCAYSKRTYARTHAHARRHPCHGPHTFYKKSFAKLNVYRFIHGMKRATKNAFIEKYFHAFNCTCATSNQTITFQNQICKRKGENASSPVSAFSGWFSAHSWPTACKHTHTHILTRFVATERIIHPLWIPSQTLWLHLEEFQLLLLLDTHNLTRTRAYAKTRVCAHFRPTLGTQVENLVHPIGI